MLHYVEESVNESYEAARKQKQRSAKKTVNYTPRLILAKYFEQLGCLVTSMRVCWLCLRLWLSPLFSVEPLS